MKGLFIKDVMVVYAQRKKFMLLIIGISLMLSFKMDADFIVSYLCLIGMILGLNAYNYDENNNGLPYLMTLPTTRKGYALEKHFFAMASVTVFWILGLIMQFFSNMIQKVDMNFIEHFPTYLRFWILFLIFTSAVTFFEIRFGSEKSRIVLLLMGGICFAVGIYGMEIAEKVGIDTAALINMFSSIPEIAITVLKAVIPLALIGVTAILSMNTIEKRDF